MTDELSTASKLGSAIRREPLVLFVVLGAVLYGGWTALAPPDVETVRIESEALRGLETQEEDLRGRPLTDEERETLREGYIDDEVLLREALNRGLQWSDFRVRQRLTRIMRGAMTETVADPSVAQLQAYFRDNIDRYSTAESVTFEQVFSPWGEEVTDQELQEIKAKLQSGADPDRFGVTSLAVASRMQRQTRVNLVRSFGADFADQVERLSTNEWSGPLESVQGTHLVKIVEHHPPQVAVFENVEPYLRQEWLMTRTRELQQERIDEIRRRYRIEIDGE
jgi:hypothetical protein